MTDYERVSLMLLSYMVARSISKSGAQIRHAEDLGLEAVTQAAVLIGSEDQKIGQPTSSG
jgi:hypothetical protein